MDITCISAYSVEIAMSLYAMRANGIIIISNTMTLGKLVIKCPLKTRENLWKSRGR